MAPVQAHNISNKASKYTIQPEPAAFHSNLTTILSGPPSSHPSGLCLCQCPANICHPLRTSHRILGGDHIDAAANLRLCPLLHLNGTTPPNHHTLTERRLGRGSGYSPLAELQPIADTATCTVTVLYILLYPSCLQHATTNQNEEQ